MDDAGLKRGRGRPPVHEGGYGVSAYVRKRLNLDPRQLASVLGCSHVSVYRWEERTHKGPDGLYGLLLTDLANRLDVTDELSSAEWGRRVRAALGRGASTLAVMRALVSPPHPKGVRAWVHPRRRAPPGYVLWVLQGPADEIEKIIRKIDPDSVSPSMATDAGITTRELVTAADRVDLMPFVVEERPSLPKRRPHARKSRGWRPTLPPVTAAIVLPPIETPIARRSATDVPEDD
jgi:hypothetical protein